MLSRMHTSVGELYIRDPIPKKETVHHQQNANVQQCHHIVNIVRGVSIKFSFCGTYVMNQHVVNH